MLTFDRVNSQDNSVNNFGLLIAYVLPGFTALWGMPYLVAPLPAWPVGGRAEGPTFAGFLFVTIEAIAAGLTVSAVRWLVLDTIHHRTGIQPPRWDFARLERSVTAFEFLVDIHYLYYKFYGNMLVALVWSFPWRGQGVGTQRLVYVLLAGLFFLGSRDALAKYYSRAGQLLGVTEQTAFSSE
jgi:hypothetical protein